MSTVKIIACDEGDGVVKHIMNETASVPRRAWWDLVGLALTRDKRLLVVLPSVYVAGRAVSHFSDARMFTDALRDAPHVLAHWLGVGWAWI